MNELEYSEMREGQKKDACKRGIIFSTTEFKLIEMEVRTCGVGRGRTIKSELKVSVG